MPNVNDVQEFWENKPLWTGESNFSPARTLPFKIPSFIHKWLDKNFGFMIYATVRKR